MGEAAGIFFFILLAGTKLLLAPGFMLAAGYGMIKTIVVTYVGALLGSIIFYYFGVAIFSWWDNLFGNPNKNKFVFSRKARAMVKIKIRYGIIGIATLAPIISVPVSALIVAKFFPGKNKVIGVYAVVFIPISIGLTYLSQPVIQPIIKLVKHIFGLD
jgi:membrane protein DedA with SNARE-associated domain